MAKPLEVMASNNPFATCVVDLLGSKIVAMMKSNESASKNIESCSIESHKCVRLSSARTKRADVLEKKVEQVAGWLCWRGNPCCVKSFFDGGYFFG